MSDAVRAGSYVVGFCRGVLRHQGYPWYRCIHKHANTQDARECARQAKQAIDQAPPGAPLPPGWVNFKHTEE